MLTSTKHRVADAPDLSPATNFIDVLPASQEGVVDLQYALRPVYDLSFALCAEQMTVANSGEARPSPLQARPSQLGIDPMCGQGGIYRYVYQLGELQEYHTRLTKAIRSLSYEMRSVSSLRWASLDVIEYTAQSSMCMAAPLTGLLSLFEAYDSPLTIYLPGTVSYAEDWLLYSHGFLQTELANFRRELRRINNVLRIIRHATAWAANFFCCVSWERRRWFLCHGARPPKTTAQAIVSLLGGACFRPLFAF